MKKRFECIFKCNRSVFPEGYFGIGLQDMDFGLQDMLKYTDH